VSTCRRKTESKTETLNPVCNLSSKEGISFSSGAQLCTKNNTFNIFGPYNFCNWIMSGEIADVLDTGKMRYVNHYFVVLN